MVGAEKASGRPRRSRDERDRPTSRAAEATPATIRIEARTRWDALDLARRLPTCSWFLVARNHERWEVYVRDDRQRRELIPQLIDAARAWAARRNLDAVVHLPDRDLPLHRAGPEEHESV